MEPLTIGLLLAAASLFRTKKTADALQYFPQTLFYDKKKKKLYLIMEVLNPTSSRLKIDGVFLNIVVNGKKTGYIERSSPFTITAKARTKISLEAKIGIVALTDLLIAIVRGKKLDIRLMGIVRSMGIDNAVDEKIPLKL